MNNYELCKCKNCIVFCFTSLGFSVRPEGTVHTWYMYNKRRKESAEEGVRNVHPSSYTALLYLLYVLSKSIKVTANQ